MVNPPRAVMALGCSLRGATRVTCSPTLRRQPADEAARRSGTHDDNGRPIVLDHGWRGPKLKSFKTAVAWPAIIACPLAVGQPAVVADRIADDRSNRV
jgi:hypothetical protein